MVRNTCAAFVILSNGFFLLFSRQEHHETQCPAVLIECAKCNRKDIPRGQVSSDTLSLLVYKKSKSLELPSIILGEENQQVKYFDLLWCNYFLVSKYLKILSRSIRLSANSIRVTNPKVNCDE